MGLLENEDIVKPSDNSIKEFSRLINVNIKINKIFKMKGEENVEIPAGKDVFLNFSVEEMPLSDEKDFIVVKLSSNCIIEIKILNYRKKKFSISKKKYKKPCETLFPLPKKLL